MKTNQELMNQDFELMKENGDYEKYNPIPTEEEINKMWEAQKWPTLTKKYTQKAPV